MLKKPISKLSIINYDTEFLDNLKVVEGYIIDELNANSIEYIKDEDKYLIVSAKSNYEILYKKYKEIKDIMITEDKLDDVELKKEETEAKNEANSIVNIIKELSLDQIKSLIKVGNITIKGLTITSDLILVEKKFLPEYEKDKLNVVMTNSECGIIINTETNDNIMNQYFCREIINKIQKLRKSSGIKMEDDIYVTYKVFEKSDRIKFVSENMLDNIEKSIKKKYLPYSDNILSGYNKFIEETYEIVDNTEKVTITIYKKNYI